MGQTLVHRAVVESTSDLARELIRVRWPKWRKPAAAPEAEAWRPARANLKAVNAARGGG